MSHTVLGDSSDRFVVELCCGRRTVVDTSADQTENCNALKPSRGGERSFPALKIVPSFAENRRNTLKTFTFRGSLKLDLVVPVGSRCVCDMWWVVYARMSTRRIPAARPFTC